MLTKMKNITHNILLFVITSLLIITIVLSLCIQLIFVDGVKYIVKIYDK